MAQQSTAERLAEVVGQYILLNYRIMCVDTGTPEHALTIEAWKHTRVVLGPAIYEYMCGQWCVDVPLEEIEAMLEPWF